MINESEEDFEKRMGKVFRLRKIDEYVHEDVFGVSLGIRNTAWVIIESNPVAYLILVSIHNRVAGAEIRIGKKGAKKDTCT